MSLGDTIRKRRKELRMTQNDLAQGVCTQAMISKIERNELNPSINIIYKLAEKLDVPLSYFGSDDQENTHARTEYKAIPQLIDILRKQLERREYAAADYLIKNHKEKMRINFSPEENLFFEWIQGILYYYLDRDIEKAIDKLTHIELTNPYSSFSIEVLTSIGVLYFEENNLDKANTFFEKALNQLSDNIPHEIKAKFFFNYSLCLKKLLRLEEALELLIRGINTLIEANSLYLLGDFFYQKALCLDSLNERQKAIDDLQTAIIIFNLQKNELFETKAKIELNALKEIDKK